MSELNFTHSNGNKVKLTTPDTLAGNRTFKLPNADGSAGQVLQTDGNGNLSFVDLPVASSMTLLATITTNMSANTLSQSLDLTGYHKLMGTVTGLQRSGGLNDTWFGFNNLTASGSFSWVRHYLDNSNDTSTNRQGTNTGYAYGSVGPGFFLNGAGFAGTDSGCLLYTSPSPRDRVLSRMPSSA